MRQRWMTGLVAGVLTLAVVGGAWAAEKVTVMREQNKPAKVSIKAGEEVYWVNGTGGTVHITFGKNARSSTSARATTGSSSRSPVHTSTPCTWAA